MSLDKKLENHKYGVKTINVKLSDLDEGSRIVKGYFASFDTLDSDNDIIRKGAFTKSIIERGVKSEGNRKIAHLRNHDFEHQIGKLQELGEDKKGLYFVSKMGTSSKGEDALRDYQDGILNEHSIGFQYIKDKIEEVKDESVRGGKYFEVKEVKLWEGSAVTFGANSLTPVIDVAKGIEAHDLKLKKILELSETLANAIKNGKGTDERLENIEQMFAQLQELQYSLKNNEPSIKDTLVAEPNEDDKIKQLLINLINQ